MIEVPSDEKIWLYGPDMDDVESEPIFPDDYDQLKELKKYLLKMLKKHNALGLAAPQVGVFKELIVFEVEGGHIMDMVNPNIVLMQGKELLGEEGCLSVPPVRNICLVPRMQRIVVEYSTVESPEVLQQIVLGSRDAVVCQHEMDHLTGTFFFDRVSTATKRNVLDSFRQWKKETRSNGKDYTRPLTPHRRGADLPNLQRAH